MASPSPTLPPRDKRMVSMPLETVHRILLTDPSEFGTLARKSREVHTPSFEEFSGPFLGDPTAAPSTVDVADQIAQTMRRAFFNDLLETVMQQTTARALPESLVSLLLETRDSIRALIPNRTDLHAILWKDDPDLQQLAAPAEQDTPIEKLLQAVVPRLLEAAKALTLLESADRAQTTVAYISRHSSGTSASCSVAVVSPNNDDDGETRGLAAFVVLSTMYLTHKAQMCQQDLADFRLQTVDAPVIHETGLDTEREMFQKRFGLFSDSSTGPATRVWVQQFVSHSPYSKQELLTSESKRVEVLQQVGWVDMILFRTPPPNPSQTQDHGAMVQQHMPEVLSLDMAYMREVRHVTRLAVMGSALALHACNAAGTGDTILKSDELSPELQHERQKLIHAMSNFAIGSQELYEQGVSAAVISLARTLNPSFLEADEESLNSRTSAVLRGEDPVIQLLDSRMRGIFRTMTMWDPSSVVALHRTMVTGRSLGSLGRQNESGQGGTALFQTEFQAAAKGEFSKKGFSLYATDLAHACLMATKAINLTCLLYGSVFMDKLIIDACQENNSTS
mmetsp:Transcript_7311/g.13121  ORF Transcript_7311/g.13121 Transcript_7311/m.13121 type:complete len:564 (-) Transcript_7311:112-1803(-)